MSKYCFQIFDFAPFFPIDTVKLGYGDGEKWGKMGLDTPQEVLVEGTGAGGVSLPEFVKLFHTVLIYCKLHTVEYWDLYLECGSLFTN